MPKRESLESQKDLLLFALEETNDGWWDWNIKDNSFYLSPRYWTTFGYDPATKNHLAEEWQEICHPEDLTKVQGILGEHFKSRGKIPYMTEVRFKHREGHWTTVICRGKTIQWDKDWNPIRFVGVHTDITERLHQQKIDSHNAKLASIGQLAAGVGHEINNPLAIIKGYVSSLISKSQKSNSLDQEKLLLNLKKIDKACRRISKITSGILSFTRRESESNLFCPRKAIEDTVELVEELYREEGISINLEKEDFDEKTRAKGDEGKFQQIILNLMDNAKFALRKSENKKISISLETTNESIQVILKDNGVGIPDTILEKIFDPFFTTREVHEGTGLGLFLVHKHVEELNGEIKLDSEPGRGTQLTIKIPAQPGSEKLSKSISHIA